MPNARTLAGMARKVLTDFLFTVKATQEMTYTRDADAALFPPFIAALQPLIDQKKFGAVLAQFPSSFHHTPENVDYLKAFRAHWRDLPVIVEFRNAPWLNDQTFARLREQQYGFCYVDEPRLRIAAAHRGGDIASSVCALSRTQRAKVVAARAGVRTLRLHVQERRAGRNGRPRSRNSMRQPRRSLCSRTITIADRGSTPRGSSS